MKSLISISVMSVVLVLVGCEEQSFTDLNQYISEVKLRPKGMIKPLPEPKMPDPFTFKPEDLRDPFKPIKPIDEKPVVDNCDPKCNTIRPDPNRRKEELEAFPMESIKMIGTVNAKAELWGLVRSSDNTVYRVKVGNYMGQNDGKIIRISPDKIELMEIVPDQPGTWREQQMSLMLTDDQGG